MGSISRSIGSPSATRARASISASRPWPTRWAAAPYCCSRSTSSSALMCLRAIGCTATRPRFRCWPSTRPARVDYGPTCATTSRSQGRLHGRQCSSIRATGPVSTPTVISPAMPGSCRPMPMPAFCASMRRIVSPARSRRPAVGRMADASSLSLPTLPPRRAASCRCSRRSRSKRSSASMRSSISSARLTAGPSRIVSPHGVSAWHR
jgi:hypothetical protein